MKNTFVSPIDLSGRLGTKRNPFDILFFDGMLILIRLTLVKLYFPPFERFFTFLLKELLVKITLVNLHILSKINAKIGYQEKWKDPAPNSKV